ncbi:FkbM family methyltransferase [Bradyrhizobium manausense]|uniref:FkbM family methyltransferase n=1 Tax=Bradyrhizobium manausense TaxID=989370 RepID=UPI001BA9C53C|nr:FkbM family methyltransferase [Bradyrhizobium manausense]MBR0725044.1 FkbM family methyltransferase [Bradyrhizobium manausense]
MLKQRFVMIFLRPYIYRELPGWGRLYERFVGNYDRDPEWRGHSERWVRGKLHGYEMLLDLGRWSNRATYFLGRFYDLPTQLALGAILRPNDTFVDVGANEGMISLLASRLVGRSGQVIAFEPNPQPRARFQAAITRNEIANVRLLNFALGAEASVLPLTVPKINSGEGSFGRPDYPAELVDVVDCEVRVGDDVLRRIRPRLVKIDVEGFECNVIRGLGEVIEECHPAIVTEIVSAHLQKAQSSVTELVGMMNEKGYRSYRLSLSAKKGLRLIPGEVDPDAHGDFLWMHPKNEVLNASRFV